MQELDSKLKLRFNIFPNGLCLSKKQLNKNIEFNQPKSELIFCTDELNNEALENELSSDNYNKSEYSDYQEERIKPNCLLGIDLICMDSKYSKRYIGEVKFGYLELTESLTEGKVNQDLQALISQTTLDSPNQKSTPLIAPCVTHSILLYTEFGVFNKFSEINYFFLGRLGDDSIKGFHEKPVKAVNYKGKLLLTNKDITERI